MISLQTADVVEMGVGHDHPLDVGQAHSGILERPDLVSPFAHEAGVHEREVSGRGFPQQVDMCVGYHFVPARNEKKGFRYLDHMSFTILPLFVRATVLLAIRRLYNKACGTYFQPFPYDRAHGNLRPSLVANLYLRSKNSYFLC